MKRIFITLGILWLFVAQLCARSVRVWGYVVDSDNRGIELANVVVIEDEGARSQEQGLSEQVGTTTNRNGYYELLLEPRDTITLVFSMVGYTTVYQRIVSPQEVMNVNVEMATSEEW